MTPDEWVSDTPSQMLLENQPRLDKDDHEYGGVAR